MRDVKLQLLKTSLGFDLLADPSDFLSVLLQRDGVFEVAETDLLTRIVRPGSICVDAGCHIGYYSCLLGKLSAPGGLLYAFDGNPASCEVTRRNLALNGLQGAEVIQAALGDRADTVSFHISTNDQTGLSSLGEISTLERVTSVPMMRLEDFLQERHVERVHFLKLDVEGSEVMVLRGLGDYLSQQLVEYILVECYDERLQLLNTSTEELSKILHEAGYAAWEYGTVAPNGWTRTDELSSRGDCSYLFFSQTKREELPLVFLSGAVKLAQAQRDLAQTQRDLAQAQRDEALRQVEQANEDTDFLVTTLESREKELTGVSAEKALLISTLEAVENSAGWRLLNFWRNFRDQWAPEGSARRRVHDFLLRHWRSDRNERH